MRGRAPTLCVLCSALLACSGNTTDGSEGGGTTSCAATTLQGDVRLGDEADLRMLSCVEHIDGRLSILQTAFRDLTGLESLKTVGGLSITDNATLVSLRGLDGLIAVNAGLFIMRNDSLVELAGLESLETVGESLFIEDNPSLVGVTGLSSLVSVVDAPNVISSGPLLRLGNNASLVSLHGLEQLRDVAGTFDVCGNPSLSELASAQDLQAERVSVLYNAALDDAAAQAFGAAVSRLPKIAANGTAFGLAPLSVCPWQADGTCDEPEAFHGDALVTCAVPPCCEVGGPTALCTAGSDELTDCPGPFGPP